MNTPRQYIELFHLLFLEQLSQKLDKKLYCLKGGCNLRFFLKSMRYSEDIDLDVQTIAKETLRNKITNILQSTPFLQILESRNIRIATISEPKQTETTQRWKLQLQIPKTSLLLQTKIEFSRRDSILNHNLEIMDKDIIRAYHLTPIYINHYSADAAFIQKINALVMRNQTQARDIFDLHHLLSYIQSPALPPTIISRIDEAKQNAMSISFEEFKSQVVAYLLPEYQLLYNDALIWDDMVLKVMESLDNYATN